MTLRGVFTALGIAILAGTCGGAFAQDSATMGRPRTWLVTVPSKAVEAAPTYERKGRRDPFQPIEVEVIQPDTRPHAVAAGRLRGIVRGSALRALVETPDGMGYILKVGDILADGRLVEISAHSVVFSVAPRRGSSVDRIVLRLPDD